MMKLASALFLAAAALIAQDSPPSADSNSSTQKKPGSVEGVVINSVTGLPVKKATVRLRNLRGRFSYVSTSDLSGRFRFDAVEPGDTYMASADNPGFAQSPPTRRRFDAIRVAEAQRVTDISIRLTPLGVISGKVLSDDGDPIPGASIAAVQPGYQMGRKQFQMRRMATADDRGEYRLFDLPEGIYYVQVTVRRMSFFPDMERVHSDRPEQGYPPVFYPNAAEVSGATAIDLPAGGDAAGIDFRLRQTRVYHIRGKAVNAETGQPVSRSGISAMRCTPGAEQLSGMQGGTGLRPDGTFDLAGLAPGPYCLQIQGNIDGGITTFARREVTLADADLEDVILSVSPGITIKGSATVEGTPPAGWKVHQVYLYPESFFWGGPGARVQEDGSFTLENVVPQTYTVQANAGPKTYLKSIVLGDRDVSEGRINVTPGSGPLALVFATDAGELKGSVQDGKGDPAAAAYITMAPDDRLALRRDLFRTSMSNDRGEFVMPALAPGVYKVLAWGDVDMMLIQVPEFRKQFEGRAVTVTIGSNGHETVQLKLLPADEVEEARKKFR